MKKIVEIVHGKNTPEYFDAKHELADLYLQTNNLNAAYKECLEGYELAKQIYGSEINNDTVDILSIMSSVKMKLHQFEESRNLLIKCKEIEEQLSSKFSQRYKILIGFEKNLNQMEGNFNKKKIGKRKTNFLSKIAPNTPVKFTIFWTIIATTAIGIAYFIKKK